MMKSITIPMATITTAILITITVTLLVVFSLSVVTLSLLAGSALESVHNKIHTNSNPNKLHYLLR